jgi:hypothetical protein
MPKNIFILPLFLIITISINGQISTGNKELYKWFDTTIKLENTELINGTVYTEKYKSKNGHHKFYSSSSFQAGDIVYDGQHYFDIAMKYDIHDDEIIVKIPTQTSSYTIQLVKEKVDSFSINDSDFISISNLTNDNNGFYEIIFKNSNLVFYKKNIKTSNKYFIDRSILYSFKSKDQYFLYFKSKYHKITKPRKDFIKLFPKHEKDINLFYKSQSELLKIDYDLFIKNLMTELNDTTSE